MGTIVRNSNVTTDRSPSGLAIRHLVTREIDSTALYAGEQWLEPDERVLLHTHPVDEILLFTSGTGEVTLGDEVSPIEAGRSVFIPAGERHGFRNTGTARLHLFVIFPGGGFAQTDIADPGR